VLTRHVMLNSFQHHTRS